MALPLRALAPALLPLLVHSSPPARAETDASFEGQLRRMAYSMANDFSAARTREERIALATHVPALFGFRYVCQHQPAGGAPVGVVPGDTIESAGKSTIVCPGGLTLALEDKAKVTLRQTEDVQQLKVEAGPLKITFGKSALSLLAADMELLAEGKSVVQELELRPEKDAMAFFCNKGNVIVSFEAGPAGVKNFLGSLACRMEMREGAENVASQVLPGDAMMVPNRMVARDFRPKLPELFGGQLPQPPINVWFSDNNTKLTVLMSTLVAGQKAACELHVQEAVGAPAKMVKAFTADVHQLAVPLDSPIKGQGYFVVCEADTGAFASQLVVVP